MRLPFIRILLLVLALACGYAHAQNFDSREIQLLYKAHDLKFDLARYSYLKSQLPTLSASQKFVANQFLYSAENEMGLYDQATVGFPIKLSAVPGLVIPAPEQWRAEDASDVIVRMAANRRIVMINEAHHNAHTRELTLSLLPRLRALGFGYFAVEALSGKDGDLARRGYPVLSSGSEYLHEPIYGELVREALRLGFKVVAYESDASAMEARESDQARNIMKKIFKIDPDAKVLIHTGYAHIDKAKGRLGNTKPLAMQLEALTGYQPLSIDQVQIMEVGFDPSDTYHRIAKLFKPEVPVILVSRKDGQAWSANADAYDANVILPASISLKSFGEVKTPVSPPSLFTPNHRNNELYRPEWLTLGGKRTPRKISSSLCKGHFPCLVEAIYADESDDAVAADRYVFFEEYASSRLYLRAGQYRLRALDDKATVVYQENIKMSGH